MILPPVAKNVQGWGAVAALYNLQGERMAIQELKFSYNWNNKLNCKYFTTIRRFQEKYQAGKIFHVILKTRERWVTDFGRAVAVDVRMVRGSDLNEYICGLDTGYSVEETKNIFKRMYKKDSVDDMLFSFVLLKFCN